MSICVDGVNDPDLVTVQISNVEKTFLDTQNDDASIGSAESTEGEDYFPLEDVNTLFVFGPDSPVRVGIANVLGNVWYERVMMLIIIASCILLACQSPLYDPDSSYSSALNTTDYVFSTIFALEMICKVIKLPNVYYAYFVSGIAHEISGNDDFTVISTRLY